MPPHISASPYPHPPRALPKMYVKFLHFETVESRRFAFWQLPVFAAAASWNIYAMQKCVKRQIILISLPLPLSLSPSLCFPRLFPRQIFIRFAAKLREIVVLFSNKLGEFINYMYGIYIMFFILNIYLKYSLHNLYNIIYIIYNFFSLQI